MNFTAVHADKSKVCREILESLPDWFGIDEARESYITSIGEMPMVACFIGGRPIGFLSLKIHNNWNAEIYVMAVLPDFHGNGIGTRLIAMASTIAKNSNARLFTVKTLSSSAPSKHYAATRRFYKKCGFEPFEEFPDLWGKESPCLLMVKSVG